MKRDKKRTSGIMYNYILVYLCIVICIIGILWGYLYHFYYETVYADFCSLNGQYLTSVSLRHENEMNILNDIMLQRSFDSDKRQLKLRENGDKVRKLMVDLKSYTAVSQFFSMMMYQYYEDEFIYNGYSSVNIEYFLNKGCILGETSSDELRDIFMSGVVGICAFKEQSVQGTWITNYVEDRSNMIIFGCGIIPEYEETLLFFVPGSFYDELLLNQNLEKYRTFLYFDGKIIVSRGDMQISDSELEILVKATDIKELSQKQVKIGENKYLLSLQEGNTGIVYGTLQSLDVFKNKFMARQWFIMWVLICTIALCFVGAFFIRSISKKIRYLNLLVNEEASYNLSQIERGIQALITSQQELNHENSALKKSKFIMSFIRGDFYDRRNVIESANDAQMVVNYEKYLVMLLCCREEDNAKVVDSLIEEMIGKEEGVDGYGIRMLGRNQNLFVLFGEAIPVMEEMLARIMKIAKEKCGEYVMSVSNYHTDFRESSQAYLEADAAFENYLLVGNSRIIRFSEVSQRDYVSLIPDIYLQWLKYAIRKNDISEVEKVVKDICDKISGENVTLFAFRVFYNNIIQILLTEWKNMREEMDNYYNVFTLSQCMNIQDFSNILCEICRAIINKRMGNKMQNSDIVKKAVDYMRQNFWNPDLTMSTLAEYLKISSVTLSVEFKNEMDMTPSDYLGNLRMEKAKELVINTNLRVKEISLQVGYEDDHVFMRRFKKYTGMTLSQYRMANRS